MIESLYGTIDDESIDAMGTQSNDGVGAISLGDGDEVEHISGELEVPAVLKETESDEDEQESGVFDDEVDI